MSGWECFHSWLTLCHAQAVLTFAFRVSEGKQAGVLCKLGDIYCRGTVFFSRDAHFSSFHLLKELLTFCTGSADDFAEYLQNIDYNTVVWEF